MHLQVTKIYEDGQPSKHQPRATLLIFSDPGAWFRGALAPDNPENIDVDIPEDRVRKERHSDFDVKAQKR
jgi:hypothetical protein